MVTMSTFNIMILFQPNYNEIMPGNPDVMTWFPRREDYEPAAPQAVPDETVEEKIHRLNDTIQNNQENIKEIVDGNSVQLEHKIYRTMDLHQDMGDLAKLLEECESKANKDNLFQDELKKARVGIINLKAYLSQVDCTDFALAIRNQFQFEVGCQQGFGPWLTWAETKLDKEKEKPLNFDHCRECEQKACLFLKVVVKGNKSLKMVQAACDGIRGSVEAQEAMAKLQER